MAHPHQKSGPGLTGPAFSFDTRESPLSRLVTLPRLRPAPPSARPVRATFHGPPRPSERSGEKRPTSGPPTASSGSGRTWRLWPRGPTGRWPLHRSRWPPRPVRRRHPGSSRSSAARWPSTRRSPAACREAAQRLTMHVVVGKTEAQQAQQAQGMLFRTRDITGAPAHPDRQCPSGHLAEFGVVAPQGPAHVRRLAGVLEDGDRKAVDVLEDQWDRVVAFY